MTREERDRAIGLLDNLIGMIEDNQGDDYDFALRMGIKALSDAAENTTSEQSGNSEELDCISREDAIKTVRNHWGEMLNPVNLKIQDDLMKIPGVKHEPKTAWIPLKWEIEGISCDIPEELDGNWLLFTNGKCDSIERIKKDAQDHFYPDGRCFELEDAVAWMPLPESYKTESEK